MPLRDEPCQGNTLGNSDNDTGANLPKSAPQLHTLCIRNRWVCIGIEFSFDEDFLCDTERLQRVELINCKISWDSPLLTGLTRLTLQDSLKANSSIIQFLHALTDLRLEDSIPNDSDGPSTYPVVDLPCLRVLRISSGVGAMTTVLRHTTFPHSAILKLTCKENQSTQIDFSNFLSVLAIKFLSSLVIRRFGDLDISRGLRFYLWTTATIFPSSLVPAQVELVLTWPSPQPRNHVKALTCVFDAMTLPLQVLTQLQISTLAYIDSQTWVETFGKLPLLERVCVQSHATHSFLEALIYKPKAAEKSKTAYSNVSFPKLRYIHVKGANFDGTIPWSLSVDMLLDCLRERCERYKCSIWMIATISHPMMLKDLKKSLLMLSGME